MAQNVEKTDIEATAEKLNSNISNSNNTKNTEVNNIIKNVDIDTYQFKESSTGLNGAIEDIHDLIFPNSVDAQLRDMNLEPKELGEIIHYPWLYKGQIESITECGVNGENKKVKIVTGNTEHDKTFECLLVPKAGKYVLYSIKYNNGITVHCDMPDSEKKQIKDSIGLSDDVDIFGWYNININGRYSKIYWLEGIDAFRIEDGINSAISGLKKYPAKVVDKVFSSGDFKGFFFGGSEEAPRKKDINVIGFWAGYAQLDEYIYCNVLGFDEDTMIHEFAHILDSTLVNGNGHYTESEPKILSLYDKYKKIILEINVGGYSAYYSEMPNVKEFFAKAVTQYLLCPNDLNALMPEVYDYMRNFFENI